MAAFDCPTCGVVRKIVEATDPRDDHCWKCGTRVECTPEEEARWREEGLLPEHPLAKVWVPSPRKIGPNKWRVIQGGFFGWSGYEGAPRKDSADGHRYVPRVRFFPDLDAAKEWLES